ncbi:MAG TPA: carboxypeptidase-like regulatory domain-containing protein [Longimicrobium sp.]|nr:carboxypeptidase-like regulatory domain-containing protein [Longimicrobium sp.]
MKTQTLLAAAALLVLAALPARAQQAERILVTGTVADSVTGDAIYGVAIATTTTPDHTASDSTGAFTLSVPAGTAVMLTFTGRGFERVGQVVTATTDVDLGRIALLPAAVALAPIQASVSQLDRRVRGVTGTTFVYNTNTLEHTGERDLFDFVLHHAGLHPAPCNALATGPMTECFLVRGYPRRPELYVNETRIGQLSLLRVYRPEDVGRVEIFAGGAMVRVYTRQFLEQMARANARPDPLPPF